MATKLRIAVVSEKSDAIRIPDKFVSLRFVYYECKPLVEIFRLKPITGEQEVLLCHIFTSMSFSWEDVIRYVFILKLSNNFAQEVFVSFKVFVSYSTDDLPQVEKLQQQLKGTPIDVFVAENSVLPSEDLSQAINSAIEQCNLFVLVWSKHAEASTWVSQEIGKATALRKRILPLILDDGMSLPGFIQNLKYLPVYKDSEEAIKKARSIIIEAYEEKTRLESAAAQDEKDKLALIGIGAFLLWAFNK